ncbi:MAG TPA: UDP-N-acetylmuramoyl-L-alanine--D-glutamate ligase [Burkholderiales bacterium]|nr:UDP-N-acetylmuramoyl-L-alanine--D-glutamate ligase [Burkholderiales bacterium]
MREPLFDLLPRPQPVVLAGKRVLVLGLGDTGLSVARWVKHQGGTVRVADTRESPPRKQAFAGELHTGPFSAALLHGVDLLCLSPGLPLTDPLVRKALQQGIPVVGDIELFAWHARQKSRVLAVTGTNGKSTVTALAGHLLREAGVDCEVAGNIGPAVLDASLKRDAPPAAWVLELSSYQLETTWSLDSDAAVMLNLTEDHLDRYPSLAEYGAAKARIFLGSGIQVLNRDDRRSLAMAQPGRTRVTFGLDRPAADGDFGVDAGVLVQGRTPLLRADELPILGLHNVANALAACALARTLGILHRALAEGLRSFHGLAHRLQLVASQNAVDWYDDSKGTNVGATVAALRGLGKKTILILGGDGKGQDFSPLAGPAAQFARMILLIGRDAPRIAEALKGSGVKLEHCGSLEEAVEKALRNAAPGDAVLLSPACASWDMFRDYRHRGEVFAAAVKRLLA